MQEEVSIPESGISIKVENEMLLVEGKTDSGFEFNASFDTGSLLSVVDESFLSRFDHEYIGIVLDYDHFGNANSGSVRKMAGKVYRLRNVRFSDLAFGDLYAIATSSKLSPPTVDPVPMVLGMAPFRTATFSLIFSENKLIPGLRLEKKHIWMRFALADRLPTPMVWANSQGVTFPMIIDTGWPNSVRGFLFPGETIPTTSDRTAIRVNFPEINISGLTARDIDGLVLPNPAKLSLLGVRILRELNWTFDFLHKQIGLESEGFPHAP